MMSGKQNELVRHDIAVSNVIFGSAHFMTLHLPGHWEIAPGVSHPEVMAAHDRADRKWIAAGRAWYVLYHAELGWAMELHLETRQKDFRAKADGQVKSIEVHGHPAIVRRWTRKRGLLQAKTITFVEVTHTCNRSERSIRITLSGRCPEEGFSEVLASIARWRCH